MTDKPLKPKIKKTQPKRNEKSKQVLAREAKPLFKYAPTDELTLEQVAQLMGITRERVRQIESSALGKLRKELYKRGYDADSFLGQLVYGNEDHITHDADY